MSRLTPKAYYGQHVELTCINHPDKRWNTKNISPLGCRNIWYNLHNDPKMGPECKCSLGCLRPVEIDGPDIKE